MSFDARSVFERDRWRCTLCGVSLATTVEPHHNLAPTVDHIRAQARGGGDELSNLQAAHRRCNAAKGVSESFDPSGTGSGSLHMTVTPSGDLMFDILAAFRENNPEMAAKLDQLLDDDEPVVEIPIPDLNPEHVGPVYDEAIDIATAYAEGIAASDEIVEIVEESLEELDDAEEVFDAVARDLLEIASIRMAATLQESLPDAAGLAPIWGLRPFHEQEWPVLASIILDYAGARATIELAVEDALIESGEESEFVLELRLLRLEDEAIRFKKAGRLEEADQRWLAVLDLGARLQAESEWYASKGPSATPYMQLAVIRRRLGDTEGEVEILERYEAAVGSRTTLGSSGKKLLKRLEVRRSGRT